MKWTFSIGRLIAFALSAALIFYVWINLFASQGNGANVLLALVLAIFAIYWATTSIGPAIDDWIFHGGSRERALALRSSEHVGVGLSAKLNAVKSKKRTENKAEFDACQAAVRQLFATIREIRSRKPGDAKSVATDLKKVALAEKAALSSAESFFGKGTSAKPSSFAGLLSLALALSGAVALRVFIVEPYQIPSGSMIPTLLVGDHLFVSKLSYGIMNPFSKEASYLVRWSTPKPGEVVIFQAPSYVPRHAGETWIKRVIAGPGQTVRLENTVLYVDDKPYTHVTPEKDVHYKDFYGTGSQSSYSIGSGEGTWVERDGIEAIEKIGDVEHSVYQNHADERRMPEDSWPLTGSDKARFILGTGCDYEASPGLECNEKNCRVKEGFLFVMGDNRGFSSDGRCWGALPIDNVKGHALFVWMSVDGSENSLELGRFKLPAFRWSRWFRGIH